MAPMNSGARPHKTLKAGSGPPATPPTRRKPRTIARNSGHEAHASRRSQSRKPLPDAPSDHEAEAPQDPADQPDLVQDGGSRHRPRQRPQEQIRRMNLFQTGEPGGVSHDLALSDHLRFPHPTPSLLFSRLGPAE